MPGNFLIDPVDFLNTNLIVPRHQHLGTTQQSAGVIKMCLFKSPQPATKHGKNMDRWLLCKYDKRMRAATQDASKLAGVFDAYWCPYDQNQTFSCNLGSEAPYMFTATMDGCSFGVGSQTGDGSCRVAHANAGTFGANREAAFGLDGARQFQRSEQANQLKHAIGDNISVISPLDYMADVDQELVLKSTTFGVRKGGTWEFHTQKYWLNNGKYFFREVTRQI